MTDADQQDHDTGPYVVRRAWRAAPLVAALERYEPRTTAALVALMSCGVTPPLLKA